ncbi:chromosome segregation protein Spc25 [Gracilaria domingensis]|nr:chromosome segregation protein Spc25 [Gracilaria domingensis]
MSTSSSLLETAVGVDSSTAKRMNENLEKINRLMGLMDQQTEESTKATRESTRILKELAEKVIQQDQKRDILYMNAMSDRKENLEKEQAMCKFAEDALEAREGQFKQLHMQKTELEEAVESLREKVATLPYERKRYESKLNEGNRQLRNGARVLEGRLKQVNQMLQRDDDSSRKFESFLGMNVRAVEDKCLEFSFKNVKIDAPQKEFKVTVFGDDGRFTATQCDPEVDNFRELKEQLAKDGLLIDFLHRGFTGAVGLDVRNLNITSVLGTSML